MKFAQHLKKEEGFSLVEVILYMTLFVILSTVLIATLFGMTKSYKEARATNDLIDSASVSMERMTREIRDATSLDMTTSVFDTNPGVLKLNTTTLTGTPKTVQFDTGAGLEIIDSTETSPARLTGSHVSVNSLIFREITTTHGKAVRIEMTLHSLRSPTDRSVSYTDTVALRGAY